MADEVISDVRRIRHEISRQCEHDVHKVVAYYRAIQDELKRQGQYRFFKARQADDARETVADASRGDPA